MNIAILSPFNPAALSDYYNLEAGQDIQSLDNHVVSSSVDALVRGLLNLGHRVTVITSHAMSLDEIHLKGDALDVYMVTELKTWKERLIPTFYCTALKVRRRLQTIIGQTDVIHAHWTFRYPLAAMPFVRKVPTVCSVRDWYPMLVSTGYFKSRMDRMYHRYAFSRAMRCRDLCIVANSGYTQRQIADYTHRSDVPIVPNSVRDEFVMQGGRDYPDHISLLSIQQNVEVLGKNVRLLVQAFAKVVALHPDARLTIVGAYHTDAGSVYGEVQRLGIGGNVTFTGKCAHLDLIPLLDAASALVHPSLEETFGNIFLEAIARRLPVIGGKDSGAVPYVLEHGRIGVLCDVTSADSIAEAILRLHSDADERKRLIDESYKHLIDNYTEQAVAKRYVDIYTLLIDRAS